MQGRGFGEGRPSLGASARGSAVENPLVNAGDTGVTGSIPGLGRSPGGGHGNPLQDSCLENPMDRGAWWATVHGVAKSRTGLKRLCMGPSLAGRWGVGFWREKKGSLIKA